MKRIIDDALKAAELKFQELHAAATTENMKVKLSNLNSVCRSLVVDLEQRLSLGLVLRHYKAKFPDASQSIAESTIRNSRAGGNPYGAVYRLWAVTAEAVIAANAATRPENQRLLTEDDIRRIESPTLRHQVTLLLAQNRSLHNQVNIFKKVQDTAAIRMNVDENGNVTGAAQEQALTEAEIEAIRDFVRPDKLKAKSLKVSKHDAVVTMEGRPVADPGFLTALQKIAKIHQRRLS
jgi:hypothetical protein